MLKMLRTQRFSAFFIFQRKFFWKNGVTFLELRGTNFSKPKIGGSKKSCFPGKREEQK